MTRNTKENILIVIIAFILVILINILKTYCIYLIWNKLIAPTFGLQQLGFWVTWGIVTLIDYVGRQFKSSTTINNKRWY